MSTLRALFILLLCLVLYCSGTVAVVGGTKRARSKLPSIGQLQAQGQAQLSMKKYQSASYCFSAILQLAQGSMSPEQLQSRRHCGLQLAQCELELGNHMQAIARCCEVLSESPEIIPSFDENETYVLRDEAELKSLPATAQLAHDLGRAHFLRGQCLKRIGQPHMALQDLEAALRYLPDEMQVHDEIAGLESAGEGELKGNLPSLSHDPAANPEELSEPLKPSIEEERVDLFEECLLQHPSLVFTRKQLRRLGKKSPPSVTVRPLQQHSLHTLSGGPRASAPLDFSSLLGFGSPSMGEGNGNALNMGDLGFGGVGGVSGGVSSGVSGALTKLVSFAPMMCSLAGLPPATTQSIVHALSLLSKIVAGVQRTCALVRTYSDVIVVALAVVWLAATVQSYRKLQINLMIN